MAKLLKNIQIIATILLFLAIFVAFKTAYTYNQEHIVCNPDKCVIEHISLPDHKIIKTDKLDIKNIKEFETKAENSRYYLYAKYKNGSSKRISPVNVSLRYRQFIDGPVIYLNSAILENNLNIDLYFPANEYFPEYGY